jgi:hypothetical protein
VLNVLLPFFLPPLGQKRYYCYLPFCAFAAVGSVVAPFRPNIRAFNPQTAGMHLKKEDD